MQVLNNLHMHRIICVFLITKTGLLKYTENFTTKKWKFSGKNFKFFSHFCSKHRLCSAPSRPIWRGGLPLLPFPATPLPFLSCLLSCFNSRHKTLHFGENFMKIGPKLKTLSMSKGQCYVYPIFEVFIVEWDYIFVISLDTKHITWHMMPSSCMTAQKVPYPAPLCPQILAGALLWVLIRTTLMRQF